MISAAIFFELVHFYFAHVSHCSPFRLSNGNGHIRLTFALKFPSLTIVSEVCGGDTSYDVSLHSSQNIYTEETPSCALSSRYFQLYVSHSKISLITTFSIDVGPLILSKSRKKNSMEIFDTRVLFSFYYYNFDQFINYKLIGKV